MGSRLRERREHIKLSLGQVAEYEQIGRQYLSKLELGVNEPPTWPLLAQLARRYNTSADYLLGLTDDPSPCRDEPLPEVARDVIEIMLGLSEGRRAELLAHARVLDAAEFEAELAASDFVFAYLASLPNGKEIIVGFEEALRTGASGLPADIATAERLIDLLAAQTAKKSKK